MWEKELKKREVLPKEFKRIALEILIDFDNVCKKNNLNYTLAYGTLLGAVRHKGYIPWDDDIDVIMLREDYEKFVLIANEQLEKKHRFVSLETDANFTAPLAKIINLNTELKQTRHVAEKMILGVYIDVFVYDYIPNKRREKMHLYKRSVFYQKAWGFCENKPAENTFIILAMVRKTFNRTNMARFFAEKLKHNAIANLKKEDYVASLMFGEHFDRSTYELPKNFFEDLIELEFEGYAFKAIRKYDYCLSKWYGKYMQLPPIEEQVNRHKYTVFYKEG